MNRRGFMAALAGAMAWCGLGKPERPARISWAGLPPVGTPYPESGDHYTYRLWSETKPATLECQNTAGECFTITYEACESHMERKHHPSGRVEKWDFTLKTWVRA